MFVMEVFHIITMILTIQITKAYSTNCEDRVSVKRKLSLKSFRNNTGHWTAQVTMLQDESTNDNIKIMSYPLNIDLNFERGSCSGVEFQKIEALLTIPPLTPGDDYKFYSDLGYYKFHPELKMWKEARDICENEGAQLAIVNTDSKSKLLKQIFDQYPDLGKYAFVGFHNQKAEEICFLPDEHGPCSDDMAKWFYDRRDGVCKQFLYGGCGGNDNRFSSQQECEEECGDKQDICDLPKVVGPCSGSILQWYYDRTTDECYEFDYGGCQGNKNKFDNKQQCEEYCKKYLFTTDVHALLQTTQGPRVYEVGSTDICSLLVDPGPCQNSIVSWYYDKHVGICSSFAYGGCSGNANRFQSVEQCERQCGEFKGLDVCSLQHEDGHCLDTLEKWYYDGSSQKCRQFSYTGCGGNGNRFSSLEECESVCLHYQEVRPLGNDTDHYRQDQPPSIVFTETDVEAEEGYYVTLKCTAQGHPSPHIVWRKGNVTIDISSGRFRLLLDGSLQIIGLYRSDAGIYICTADNGVGQPAHKETHLKVTDPHRRPAEILGENNACVVVTLGAPTSLPCYAVGWPRPSVSWWRGERLLPLSSDEYHQRRDYVLLIRSVDLKQLGPYTCQAYNGQGKPPSFTVTVQAIWSVDSNNTIDSNYFQFLVPAPVKTPERNKMASLHTTLSYLYQLVCPPAATWTIPALTMTSTTTSTTPQPVEELPRDFTGEPINSAGFTEFTRGEPNNRNYRGHKTDSRKYCRSINRDGKLNDVLCTVKYPFICER